MFDVNCVLWCEFALFRFLLAVLLVVCRLVLFACCILSTIRVCCVVRVVCWLFLVDCRVLCVRCCVLLVVCCLSCVDCVRWSGDCWSLFAVRC